MYDNEYEILTVDDVCEFLCIGKNTAYDLLRKKEIKGFRIHKLWKIPRLALYEYIKLKSSLN